mmetsp:Transcript_43447/g.104973  ORF Transcript_43447/g.104973 Transcript_43447/m.104973 type:complete len:87 (+) Transcript_43447:1207-1467(+)
MVLLPRHSVMEKPKCEPTTRMVNWRTNGSRWLESEREYVGPTIKKRTNRHYETSSEQALSKENENMKRHLNNNNNKKQTGMEIQSV